MGEIHKRENPLNTMKNISILDIKSVQKFQKLELDYLNLKQNLTIRGRKTNFYKKHEKKLKQFCQITYSRTRGNHAMEFTF